MADLKITELAALTTVLGEDLLAIVDDPTGTASTKKIRTDDFQSTWHVGVKVYNNANTAVDHNTWTTLTFNSEGYDTDSMHSTGTNTSRLTCQSAGYYSISCGVDWAANAAGDRGLLIKLGGSDNLSIMKAPASTSGESANHLEVKSYLAVGNYVELLAYQSSGGALDARVIYSTLPHFMMHRIG